MASVYGVFTMSSAKLLIALNLLTPFKKDYLLPSAVLGLGCCTPDLLWLQRQGAPLCCGARASHGSAPLVVGHGWAGGGP